MFYINKKNFFIIISLFGAFFLGLIFGAFFFSEKKALKIFEEKKEKLSQEIKKEFYQKLAEQMIVSPEPSGISQIQAQVIEIKKDYLLVKVLHPFDPLNYLFPEKVKVFVNEKTEILSQVPQDPEVLSRATYEYNKAIKEGKIPPEFPPLSIEKEIPFSEIKIGETLKIFSDENIKNKEQFFAKKIVVQRERKQRK